MSADSKIEWTDTTWNPTTGCSKVSPGCAHCYAETLTQRYAGAKGWPAEFKPWTPTNAAENVVLHPSRLEDPFKWRTPRRVFVNSMSDLFHEEIPDHFRAGIFSVMRIAERHQFQVLTKRPEIMRDFVKRWLAETGFDPLPNVWLGVTVENQRWADERIPILLDTPAAVRFVSAEPLLGRINLFPYLHVTSSGRGNEYMHYRERLDWVIVGGESGAKHRPFDPSWALDIVCDCRNSAVACFVKQLGGARPGNRLEDLPADLRVREFPV
jgi:protein gp37